MILVGLFGLYIDIDMDIMSSTNKQFFFLLLNWILFIYFHCLVGIFITVLVRYNKNKYPCLILKFTGRNIHSFIINYDVKRKSL